MADFYSSIKNLNDKLNKFIKEYESLDDMDPLSMNLLKSFKKKIAHFNASSLVSNPFLTVGSGSKKFVTALTSKYGASLSYINVVEKIVMLIKIFKE